MRVRLCDWRQATEITLGMCSVFFFFQAEDGIRDVAVTGVQTCALPIYKLLDRAREQREKIGTTGRGIGPTYEDKYGRRGIRVGDLRNPERAKELVCARVHAANEFLELLGSSERADAAGHVQLLERLAPRLLPIAVDAGRVVYEALQRAESVLLEGAQGALLDVDHGTYPYVTSSNTTAGGAAVGAGIGPTAIDAVLGVVQAYTTRVGNGAV